MALPVPPGYRTLDAEGLIDFLVEVEGVREQLGGRSEEWRVREVGDGNLNLVFIAEGPAGGVCVKQALPYLRAAGESWPMPLERAFFEFSYYAAVAPYVGGRHSTRLRVFADTLLHRHGVPDPSRHPAARTDRGKATTPTPRRDVAEYIARASFFTSDLAVPFERKMDLRRSSPGTSRRSALPSS